MFHYYYYPPVTEQCHCWTNCWTDLFRVSVMAPRFSWSRIWAGRQSSFCFQSTSFLPRRQFFCVPCFFSTSSWHIYVQYVDYFPTTLIFLHKHQRAALVSVKVIQLKMLWSPPTISTNWNLNLKLETILQLKVSTPCDVYYVALVKITNQSRNRV